MPYAEFSDLRLYYEDMGRGDAVLFLHSHFSRGLIAFGAQIQPFQGKYRCLFPDLRGHGRTVCDDLTWDSRRIADDMAAFLDHIGIERAHLIGYSFGCNVGMYLASKYPRLAASLVCIGGCCAPSPDGAEDYLPENLIAAGDTETIETMKTRHFDAHRGNWQEYLRQTVADWLAHPQLSDAQWRAITCPTLFINGEHDPFGDCFELCKKVPHAQAYQVVGGSHRPHFPMEQAAQVNSRILDFLSEVRP